MTAPVRSRTLTRLLSLALTLACALPALAEGPAPEPQPTPQEPPPLPQEGTKPAQAPVPESDQPPGDRVAPKAVSEASERRPGAERSDAAEAPTPKKLSDWYPEDTLNRVMPFGLQVLLHGYFRAPLRLAFGSSSSSSMMGGSSTTNIRSPWLVDDDYFRSGFAYTRLQEQDFSEVYLGVGNKYLSGEIALMGSLSAAPTRWACRCAATGQRRTGASGLPTAWALTSRICRPTRG
jgi:hypothetical protein